MRFGVAIFPTDYAVEPGVLARMVEERGFESLFFPEHTHIPATRDTPYPPGGELPDWYSHTYDPFVALSAAAAATERLLVGTGICLVVERDPIVTAKEVASLDRLTEEAGRDPIPVTLSGAKPDPELIERGERLGVHRCSFYISPTEAGEAERQLDALASTLKLG